MKVKENLDFLCLWKGKEIVFIFFPFREPNKALGYRLIRWYEFTL